MRSRIVALFVPLIILVLAWRAGHYLVVDNADRGDAMVVLAGECAQHRYQRGLALLTSGRGGLLFVDSSVDRVVFGRTVAAQQEEFMQHTAGRLADRTKICAIEEDSTDQETQYVQRCLQAHDLHHVIIVTSDFHTRRALSIFQKRLPKYHWSAAAVRDTSIFCENWWSRREWAKTTLLEWTKLIWWETVDRWRSPEKASTAQ